MEEEFLVVEAFGRLGPGHLRGVEVMSGSCHIDPVVIALSLIAVATITQFSG